MRVSKAAPVQHIPGTMQFTCDCGKVITFAQMGRTYPKVINLSHPGPGVVMGECPECGTVHWKGTTR